jgi:tetratricopeptide (TPR) repeat protein
MRPIAILCCIISTGCVLTSRDHVQELTVEGKQLYRKGAIEAARENFLAALTLHPDNADLQFHLAECYSQLGKQAAAEEAYRKCLDLAPEHADARHLLVVRLATTDRISEANALVADWKNRSPKKPGPLIEEGWLAARAGDVEQAKALYLRALDLEPRNAHALRELGELYERLDHLGRALVLYERSLEILPDQPQVRQRLDQLKAQKVSRPKPE